MTMLRNNQFIVNDMEDIIQARFNREVKDYCDRMTRSMGYPVSLALIPDVAEDPCALARLVFVVMDMGTEEKPQPIVIRRIKVTE